jgi:GT2 family glycosyltransferase
MIAVIVLNWNNAADTLECLESVYLSKCDSPFQVYVADNGSTDDSLSLLKEKVPQASFLSLDCNLGFAEGNNRAIEQAIRDGAEYVFLLNNDAVIQEDTLSLLREEAVKNPSAAALGPKIYFYDAPTTIWCGGGECDLQAAFCYHRDRGLEDSQATHLTVGKTAYVCGCALFLRVSHIQAIGLMDPRFFLNWEEIDWCFRMRRAGFDCLYVPDAKAWHKVSSSFLGGNRGPMWYYFYYRNRLLWMKRHLSFKERCRIAKQILWPELQWRRKQLSNALERPVGLAALLGVRDYFLGRFGPGSFKRVLQP